MKADSMIKEIQSDLDNICQNVYDNISELIYKINSIFKDKYLLGIDKHDDLTDIVLMHGCDYNPNLFYEFSNYHLNIVQNDDHKYTVTVRSRIIPGMTVMTPRHGTGIVIDQLNYNRIAVKLDDSTLFEPISQKYPYPFFSVHTLKILDENIVDTEYKIEFDI